MENKEISKKVLEAVDQWIGKMLGDIAARKPQFLPISQRLKRKIMEEVELNIDKAEDYYFLLKNDMGELDVSLFNEDLYKAFEEMAPVSYDTEFGKIIIEKGRVHFPLPDNFFTKLFLGDTNRISLGRADIEDLLSLLNYQ